MQISVCKLTPELLDDWLSYFDKDAFSDNEEWCGCYCMCYHWDRELEKKRAWNCDRDCAEFNRKQAINFIKSSHFLQKKLLKKSQGCVRIHSLR